MGIRRRVQDCRAVALSVSEHDELRDSAERHALQRAVAEAEGELTKGEALPHSAVRERLLAMGQGVK